MVAESCVELRSEPASWWIMPVTQASLDLELYSAGTAQYVLRTGNCATVYRSFVGNVLFPDLGTTSAIQRATPLADRTGDVDRSTFVAALAAFAAAGDREGFTRRATGAEWQAPGPLLQALDMAMELDLLTLARELSGKAIALFPQDGDVQKAARVLAPPEVLGMRPARDATRQASYAWLSNHSEHYRGQWVALQGDRLLGTAPSLRSLRRLIGRVLDSSDTLVTKVLP